MYIYKEELRIAVRNAKFQSGVVGVKELGRNLFPFKEPCTCVRIVYVTREREFIKQRYILNIF